MEICTKCGRRINRMRKGRGGFRRHLKSKGVLCPGSWEYPHKQEEELRQRAQQKIHPTNGGLCVADSLSNPATIGGTPCPECGKLGGSHLWSCKTGEIANR